MIPNVSLCGFLGILLRVQVVRISHVGVLAGLFMVAGVVMFGCLTMVARGLIVV